jgi:acetoin utilization protein AcuB
MVVRDYMSAKVITVGRQCPIADARALLRQHRIRQIPVVDKGRLVGIVTDRDIRSAAVPAQTVGEVMAAKPTVIGPGTPIDEAARVLRKLKVGALPVVDGNRLVGIITTADVLDAFVQFCGVTEPTYLLILGGPDLHEARWRVRRIIDRKHGDLKWIYRDRRSGKVHLRLKAKNVDDIVSALEADGFDVSTILSPSRQRA